MKNVPSLIEKIEDNDIKLIINILLNVTNNDIIDAFYELIENNPSLLNYLLDITFN